jgi:hypothetical protein
MSNESEYHSERDLLMHTQDQPQRVAGRDAKAGSVECWWWEKKKEQKRSRFPPGHEIGASRPRVIEQAGADLPGVVWSTRSANRCQQLAPAGNNLDSRRTLLGSEYNRRSVTSWRYLHTSIVKQNVVGHPILSSKGVMFPYISREHSHILALTNAPASSKGY